MSIATDAIVDTLRSALFGNFNPLSWVALFFAVLQAHLDEHVLGGYEHDAAANENTAAAVNS